MDVEARIARLEEDIARLTKEMQDPALAVDHARLGKLVDRHVEMQEELDTLMLRWETLQEQLSGENVS